MIFLSSPTLLIKRICVGTASKDAYLYKFRLDFWSVGDPRHEHFARNLCFFDGGRLVTNIWR